MSRFVRAFAAAVVVLVAAGCAEATEEATPIVVVPNSVVADLVERVSCVNDIDTMVGPLPTDDVGPAVAFAVTLDPPANVPAEVLTLSVPAVASTIDAPGGPDPWVWTDPVRFADLARPIAAALSTTADLDAALLDRCLARIDAEMELLDAETYDALQGLTPEQRTIDVDRPGVVYFANRFELDPARTSTARDAADALSFDELTPGRTYEEEFRARVASVLDVLAGG